MTAHKLTIDSKVYKELEKIIEYGLDNFHEDRAYNYYNGFFKVFKHLQNMPYSGQMYKDDSTIRKYTYEKNHIIIYKINADINEIRIALIFHARQKIADQYDYLIAVS